MHSCADEKRKEEHQYVFIAPLASSSSVLLLLLPSSFFSFFLPFFLFLFFFFFSWWCTIWCLSFQTSFVSNIMLLLLYYIHFIRLRSYRIIYFYYKNIANNTVANTIYPNYQKNILMTVLIILSSRIGITGNTSKAPQTSRNTKKILKSSILKHLGGTQNISMIFII